MWSNFLPRFSHLNIHVLQFQRSFKSKFKTSLKFHLEFKSLKLPLLKQIRGWSLPSNFNLLSSHTISCQVTLTKLHERSRVMWSIPSKSYVSLHSYISTGLSLTLGLKLIWKRSTNSCKQKLEQVRLKIAFTLFWLLRCYLQGIARICSSRLPLIDGSSNLWQLFP